MSKVKRISPHDLREVSRFAEYLEDIGVLPPNEFVAKYQEYMGLNDAEAAAYLAREKSRPLPTPPARESKE